MLALIEKELHARARGGASPRLATAAGAPP
jgi:hypothetical protein